MGSLSRGAVLTPDHLDTVTLLHCLLCSQQKNLDLSHFKMNIVTMLTLCFFLPITNHHNRAGSISVTQCVWGGDGGSKQCMPVSVVSSTICVKVNRNNLLQIL